MGTTSRIAPGGIFQDPDLDFSARIALGMVASGVSDVGLVLATLDKVSDGDMQSWFDAWSASGAALAAQGRAAQAGGHQRSARWAYLAASAAYAKGPGRRRRSCGPIRPWADLRRPSQVLGRLDRCLRGSSRQSRDPL